jgi:hypothetical protein
MGNQRGEAIIGLILIGVVVGLFAAFVGNLKEVADNHNKTVQLAK